MEKQFTEQEYADAHFYCVTAVTTRQHARIFERKRNLTPEEVDRRVQTDTRLTDEEKARYLCGKALYQAGAHRD